MKDLQTLNFEKSKNAKAFAFASLIFALLLIFFLLTSLALPVIPKPIVEEGIEVNLGDSEHGSGDVQPEAVGEPAQNIASSTNAAAPQESLDNNGDEAINTPVKTPDEIKHTTPKPVVTTPKEIVKTPTPKAAFPGVNKNGGNNGTKNNNSKSQGDDFGNGDKGKPNGNPNSNSYTGNSFSGNNGLSIKSGLNGRKIQFTKKLEDDFDENAIVYVDVTVDANGNVQTATVNPRGTTTTNPNTRNVAIKNVKAMKLNAGRDEDAGTIMVILKVGG